MKRQIRKSTLILVIALALTVCCLIGTTFAWLADKATTTSTFTVGNVNISLSESSATNRRIVPGGTYTEDPKVIVRANSEDCWLFFRADKSTNFDTFLTYTVDAGWTKLESESNVYYRFVQMKGADQTFDVLQGNVVKAKDDATKTQYDTINSSNYPTLSITAYAVQRLGFDTPDKAWVEAKKLG